MTLSNTQPLPKNEWVADSETSTPMCVMSFNANDSSGAGGLAADIATMAAMGAHPLPVVTSLIMRDTAEVFSSYPIDSEAVVEQARAILEDVSVAAWKVGFLGGAEGVSAVAEIISDYPEVPLVAYLPNLVGLEDEAEMAYLDAFRELILPAAHILIGNHKNLADFLLPEWDIDRLPTSRELAVAAGELGTRYVLVTGVHVAGQKIDNILAAPEGVIVSEQLDRFEANFIGAGDTFSAAITALLASGQDHQTVLTEALSFLDQSLDAGYRPGMGHLVPDRFFWALPEEAETAEAETQLESDPEPTFKRQTH